MTNSANNSLTILQQTFFIYANFNEQEMDFYVVNPITTWTSSLGAYACTNTGSGGSPTGSGCVQVAVGATQTLTFAACAPDSSYFMWANTGGGNGNCGSNDASFSPTEDELGFATIVYTYQNPTTHVWYTFAQTLPALDSYIKS